MRQLWKSKRNLFYTKRYLWDQINNNYVLRPTPYYKPMYLSTPCEHIKIAMWERISYWLWFIYSFCTTYSLATLNYFIPSFLFYEKIVIWDNLFAVGEIFLVCLNTRCITLCFRHIQEFLFLSNYDPFFSRQTETIEFWTFLFQSSRFIYLFL